MMNENENENLDLTRNKCKEDLNSINLNPHQMSKSDESLKKKITKKESDKCLHSQQDTLNNIIKFNDEKQISSSQSNQSFSCEKQNIIFNDNHNLISKPDFDQNLEKKVDLKDKFDDLNNKDENSVLIKNNTMQSSYTDFSGINLEEFLFNILQKNIKDRIHLLKIEKELINLIKDDKKKSHKFPPMSSYHRMLVHRMAAYFGLEHIIDNNGNCVIVIKQKGFTKIPEIKFKDHIKEITCNEPKKLILKRDTSFLDENSANDISLEKKSNILNLNVVDARKSKSFEEREEQYERARARIFSQPKIEETKEKDNSHDIVKNKESLIIQKCNSNKIYDEDINFNIFNKKNDLLISKTNLEGPLWNNTEIEKQNPSNNHKQKNFGNILDNQTFYFTSSSLSSNSFLTLDNELQMNDKKTSNSNSSLDTKKETIKTSFIKSPKSYPNCNFTQFNLTKNWTNNNDKTKKLTNNQNFSKSKNSKQNSKILKNIKKNVQSLFIQNDLQQPVFNVLDQNHARLQNWLPNAESQNLSKNLINQCSIPSDNFSSQQNQQKQVLAYNVSEKNSLENKKVFSPHVLQSSNINQTQINNRNSKNNSFGKENVNGILTAPLSVLSITPLNQEINDVNRLSGVPVCYLKPVFYPNGTNTLPGDVLFSNNILRTQMSSQSHTGQMVIIPDFNTPINNFTQPNTLIPTASINLLNNQTFVPPTNFGYSINGASTSHLEVNSIYPQVSNSFIQNSEIWPQQSPLLPTPVASTRIQKPSYNYNANNKNKPKKKVGNGINMMSK